VESGFHALLSTELRQGVGGGHNLGRFRLAVTAESDHGERFAPPTVAGVHFYRNICFIERGT